MHCDEAILQTSPSQEMEDDEDLDHHPWNEDKDFFLGTPDAENMKEAISKFLDGMEEHEHSCFEELHRLLGDLPVPVQKKDSSMTRAAALE